MSDTVYEVDDVLEIGHRARAVLVVGYGLPVPVPAFSDGQHLYFDDATTTRVAAQLTGQLDIAGRLVFIDRAGIGWREHRGWMVHPLHHRRVDGALVFRFDDEWLFAEVEPLPGQLRQRSAVEGTVAALHR